MHPVIHVQNLQRLDIRLVEADELYQEIRSGFCQCTEQGVTEEGKEYEANRKVSLHTAFILRLRYDDRSTLDAPGKENLGWCRVVLLCDGSHSVRVKK